ncbi:MAG: type VI secretion system-associated FHA domain protein, partial [Pseudomonadota bacterium]
MRLELDNVTNLADGGPTTFVVEGRRSVDIGRNSYLDWTLPDPTRVVSGRHCEIKWRDGGYWITDVSTNGTFLNGSDTRLTEPWRLHTGDRISIGEYLINVVVEEEEGSSRIKEAPPEGPPSEASANFWDVPDERAAPSEPAPVRARESRPVQADVLDWVSELPAVEPQSAEPRTPEPPRPPDPPVSEPPAAPTPPEPPVATPSPTPVAEPDEPQPSWARSPAAASPQPDPVATPAPPEVPATPPAAAETPDVPAAPPAASAHQEAEPERVEPEPAVSPALSTTSFERAFAATEPDPVETPEPAEEPAPAVPPAPPAEEPAYSGFRGARAEEPAAASGEGFERFAAALAAQLGLPRDRLEARSPEALAEEVGTFIHLTTLGLQKLLKARSQSRGYMKAGAGTQIQAIGNNPFKYMPTPAAAADVLFGPQSQAYLSTRDAIEESFADLGTHQMALYAEMQAAVERMLMDLDPQSIEASAGEERGSFG